MFDLKSRTLAAGNNRTGKRLRLGKSLEFAIAVLNPTGAKSPALAFFADGYFWLINMTVIALVLSLVFGWIWVGLAAMVLSLVVDGLAARGMSRDSIVLHRLRVDSALRGLIFVGLFAAVLARSDHGVTAAAVILMGLGAYGAQFLDRLSTRWLGSRQVAVRYVPHGVQPEPLPSMARLYLRGMIQSGTQVIALGAAVAAIAIAGSDNRHALAWWIVAAGWAVCLADAVMTARSALRLGSEETSDKLMSELQRFLDDLAPTHVTYLSAGAGQSEYILNQWIPVIEQVPSPGFVLVREASNLSPIQKTSLPVVYAPLTRHVEELTAGRVNIAYYLANAGKNVHLLREVAVKHVFLNHGDSDKSTSANPVSRVYDEVWVAGQAAIDRYVSAGITIPDKNYVIVGRPQMAKLLVGPRGVDRLTVLYAPTFEGYYEESNYSSLERMGPQMIRHILTEYPDVRIIFKPHPNSGVQRPGMNRARIEIAEMLATGDHVFVDPSSPVTLYDAFDQSDVMISDISSVVTDYLYTERPVIVSNPVELNRELFLSTFPTQRSSYLLAGDLSNLDEILRDALGEDSMRSDRIAQGKYVLGDLPEGPLKAFTDATERVTRAALLHASTIENRFRLSSTVDPLVDHAADDSEEPDDD